jgi:hypothetical protein
MKRRELIEALSVYADSIYEDLDEDPSEGEGSVETLLTRYPDQTDDLGSLFKLAEELKAALVPVPVPAFRAQLRRELEAYTPAEVTVGSIKPNYRRKWLFVAAAGSTLSIVGIFVVLLRRLRAAGDGPSQPATTVA